MLDPQNPQTEAVLSIADYLDSDRTAYGIREDSKKRVFEHLSQLLAKGAESASLAATPEMTEAGEVDTKICLLSNKVIFEALLAREKLGSTGIGHGVAIPHARIDGLTTPLAALVHLQSPVDFDALDSQPVDIFFAIVVPESATEAHLTMLSEVAKLLHDPGTRSQIRHAGNGQALFDLIQERCRG